MTFPNADYESARRLAVEGRLDEADAIFAKLLQECSESQISAVLLNDLGTIAAVRGDFDHAEMQLCKALEYDSAYGIARKNLNCLSKALPDSAPRRTTPKTRNVAMRTGKARIAILSFLFNWPSSGGGIIHTVELAQFLNQDDYDVRIIAPQFAPWSIGNVDESCPFPVTLLRFRESEWNVTTIRARFRSAVDEFAPDYVIITDCWNFKPHLFEAMRGYATYLRMQAHECLCPLNNLRLLPDGLGNFGQCPHDQLSSPEECRRCLQRNGHTSGSLHVNERTLSDVGTDDYTNLLQSSIREAAAVLTLNPAVAETFRPFAKRVEVVTWGMDPSRFSGNSQDGDREPQSRRDNLVRLLFAGVVNEPIKGFHFLQQVCTKLWQQRQNFELVATGEPVGQFNEFTRFVGWKSQRQLPALYRECDICVVPTVVQDGLSRTSVEAMACERPVIASRIGGLPYSVTDGVTGRLCEPADINHWIETIIQLLDSPKLRLKMGAAGRLEFENRFTWESVIRNQYRPLLPRSQRSSVAEIASAGPSLSSSLQPATTTGREEHEIKSDGPDSAAASHTSESGPVPITAHSNNPSRRPLRILFLANLEGEWNNAVHVANTLDELGHSVTRLHEFAVTGPQELLRRLGSGQFDCLLFSKARLGATLLPDILQPTGNGISEVLRKTNVPAYMWYVDKVIGFDPSREAWMRKVAPLCRVAFVTDGPLLHTGWANFRVLRQGILRQTVQSVQVPEQERQDIAFIGAVYGERQHELEPVLQRYDLQQISNTFGPALSRVLNSFRIILGPKYPSIAHYWSDRVYVVLGHGGFFLAPEVEGMQAEGLIAGVHYAALQEDSVSDVEYWLKRPEERRRIATAGQQLVLSQFTYKNRLEELCQVIAETL